MLRNEPGAQSSTSGSERAKAQERVFLSHMVLLQADIEFWLSGVVRTLEGTEHRGNLEWSTVKKING